MSGICGIVRFDGQPVGKEEIQKMLDVMQNRGSDAEGILVEGGVGFGHKMLWTTPESLYEEQPSVSKNGNLVITADARIDNRDELFEKLEIQEKDFDVISDIDLLVRAYEKWGEECPKYLLGDFAFAIFDKVKKKFFFAKDHIGIRPFFYYMNDAFFCFASEISAIFSVSSIQKIRNECVIENFIENTTLPYEKTFFKNIKRLSPAHKIILDFNKIVISRYWFPEQIKLNNKISFEEASEKFKNLLQLAVDTRLRSAYPIGCELSGGLDSSSILCIAATLNTGKDITPFSQRYGSLECDESYYSDLVGESLGLNIQTVHVDKLDYENKYSLEKYFKLFPDWPTYGSFMGLLPIAEKAQKLNIRVLLTGQGGDHIVAGNLYMLADYFKTFQLKKLYKELEYLKWKKSIIKNYVIRPNFPDWFVTMKRKSNKLSQTTFFKNTNNKFLSSLAFREDLGYVSGAFNAFWTDSSVYHNIERFNIESRHPYFDVRLVEFCLSLPSTYKLSYGISKRVLREALKDILPDPVRIRQDKADFSKPVEIQLDVEYTQKENFKINDDSIRNNTLKASVMLGIKIWEERNFRNERKL